MKDLTADTYLANGENVSITTHLYYLGPKENDVSVVARVWQDKKITTFQWIDIVPEDDGWRVLCNDDSVAEYNRFAIAVHAAIDEAVRRVKERLNCHHVRNIKPFPKVAVLEGYEPSMVA